MPKISLIKPGTGSTQWGTDVGQNWTDIENTFEQALYQRDVFEIFAEFLNSLNGTPFACAGGGPIDVDTVIPVGQAGQAPPSATHECDKVVAALSVDSFIDSSGGGMAQMVVYPQISKDGIHWYELWTDGFTAITLGTTFPFLEHKLIQTVGAFMRFGINFLDPGGMMASMGASMELLGSSIEA